MTESVCIPQRRGRRGPSAVWIERRKRKDGTAWRIRWINPATGRADSQACGRDLALARNLRDQKKAELRDGLSGKLPDRSLADLIDGIAGFQAGRSQHTIRKTKDSLESLRNLCGDRLLQHVGKDTVMDFRSRRLATNVAVATVNKDVRQIRSALSYAQDAGWIRYNPLLRWKNARLTEPERVVRVVEPAEFKKLLEAIADPSFRVLLNVGYYQGMRRTEMANLRWSAVDLDKGAIHVLNVPEAGEFTKSRKNRSIPMHPIVRRELAAMRKDLPTMVEDGRAVPKHPHEFAWEDGQPYKPDWITHRFAKAAKDSGVSASIHDLRRSFSTLAQRAGVDRFTVKDLGGWSSVTVVEKHYTGEIKPVLERAMDLIARAQGVA